MRRILCIFLKSPFEQFTKDFFCHNYAKIHQKKTIGHYKSKFAMWNTFLMFLLVLNPLNS